jgi:hypothetical protein
MVADDARMPAEPLALGHHNDLMERSTFIVDRLDFHFQQPTIGGVLSFSVIGASP